jgi:hypothetical protein
MDRSQSDQLRQMSRHLPHVWVPWRRNMSVFPTIGTHYMLANVSSCRKCVFGEVEIARYRVRFECRTKAFWAVWEAGAGRGLIFETLPAVRRIAFTGSAVAWNILLVRFLEWNARVNENASYVMPSKSRGASWGAHTDLSFLLSGTPT